MYDATDDPYCYEGTSVLKNRLGLQSQDQLTEFEHAISSQRAEEPLPAGNLDQRHYCALHRHLYQDVYDWAGELRTVRTSKGGSMFCYPENIAAQLAKLFRDLAAAKQFTELDSDGFARAAAHFLAELNAIHPFREGNGRTQLTFLKLIATAAGHSMEFGRLDAPAMLQAMIASFSGDEEPLARLIRQLI
ncbi:Fic/DOC family protein [Bradyrhizobium sp.]|jgi:cell filamentation protein|uniref:Fic/DOC family protein n=1 Tax=Bradyrhizobium sp. TaxID=376 RepID=UPI002E026A48|nr:Fic family protein [Bradyrhizobium sp.]